MPNTTDNCPVKDCKGTLSDWEKEYADAFSPVSGHYERATGDDVRFCDCCDYNEHRSRYTEGNVKE